MPTKDVKSQYLPQKAFYRQFGLGFSAAQLGRILANVETIRTEALTEKAS